ncbi:MAG: single-stranded-DNA-specific exonuclease RecJ [Thermoleophilia bacterium]
MTASANWTIPPAPYADVRALAQELSLSETLAQVLVRRGYADPDAARAFLEPDTRVHNPYRLLGMDAARARLDRALRHDEVIAVHGDYDADGITATFTLVRLLSDLGADVRWRLPNRFTDGYGVSLAAVEELAAAGVKLLITVDCGITARAEVARARELGMDVIVTDHHEMEGALPDCTVLSPKLGSYPCPHLAGVGVAFKLAHALLEEPQADLVEVPLALRALSDVVALGTIADLVPLTGENRTLVRLGLGRLRSAPRAGLAALMEVADVTPANATAGSVGYRLAPRLNAAGRLEDASVALELLNCEDRTSALPIALRLNELNRERQAIEAAMVAEASALIAEPPPAAIVLSSPTWHEGVVGIVASRVAERFNRPTILLSEGDDEAKGSGRSVAGFDILAALESTSTHLLAFGGHRAACGLRLRRRDLDAFQREFVAHVARTRGSDVPREHLVDAIVGGHELTLSLADELERLAPHGFGNHSVSLLVRDVEIAAPRRTRNGRHLQYRVCSDGASCQAIHFNPSTPETITTSDRFDVLVSLAKNEYGGSVSAQVEVKEIVPSRETSLDTAAESRPSGVADVDSALWSSLLERLPAWPDELRDARPEAFETRLIDRRGRPLQPIVNALVGGGERVVALVAGPSARRPLSGRLPSAVEILATGQRALARTPVAGSPLQHGEEVVVLGFDALAAASTPAVRAALANANHLVFADPPLSRAVRDGFVLAAPQAWIHFAWGREELDFAEKMSQADYDVRAVARRVWAALTAGSGSFDEDLGRQLLATQPGSPPVLAVAAALRVLREAALLHVGDDGRYELARPAEKVDITQTPTYTRWHTLFQTNDYLPTCLTATR